MGERPIIYIAVAGESEEDFVQAAAKQFRGDVFIAIDPPPARDLRVEARFGTTGISVRGDAIATPATRNGAKGVLVRMVKLEPGSVAVPVWDPAAPPTPSPMSATLAKSALEGIALPRTKTATKHVVQRAPTPLPILPGTAPIPIVMEVGSDTAPTRPPPDDPVDEFATGAITNTSSLSADIAKTLHETTPPPTKTHAKLVRRTPVAGVPQVEPPKPKPVVKKVEKVEDVPPEPSIDDEWAFEQPTGKGGPIPQEVKTAPAAPAVPATGMALIGARATITPAAGEPIAKQPQVIDDDAALDSAFDAFDAVDDNDLEIPVAATPMPAVPVKPPVRPTPPSLPVVKAPGSAASALGAPAATPKPADPSTRKSQPIPTIKPRAASEPKLGAFSANDADTAVNPKSRAASEPNPAAASEPKLPTSDAPKPRAASEPDPAVKPRAASEPNLAAVKPTSEPIPVIKPRAASEPKSNGAEVAPPALPPKRPASEPRPIAIKEVPTAPIPAGTLAGALTDSARPPTPEPAVLTATAGVIEPKPDPFVATGGPANTATTVRTPQDAIDAAARGSAIGSEPPTSVGVVAAIRGSTDALTSLPRPRKWLLPAIAGVVVGGVVVIVIAMRGGGDDKPKGNTASGSNTAGPRNADVEKHLATATARIQDGKLVGPDGDTALDYLLKAKKLAPSDKQVLQQLMLLANTFERLGDGASKAGDLGEAATHYQAALTAEPDRPTAAKKLKDVEERARGNKK